MKQEINAHGFKRSMAELQLIKKLTGHLFMIKTQGFTGELRLFRTWSDLAETTKTQQNKPTNQQPS